MDDNNWECLNFMREQVPWLLQMIPGSKMTNDYCGHFGIRTLILSQWSRKPDAFNKKSSMDDVKELTGGKTVPQFVYCAGLLFLHSEHSGRDGGYEGSGEIFGWKLQTTIKRSCFVPHPKGALVYMQSWFRTTCPRPASVPHTESGYSISFESGCCAAVKQGLSRLSASDVSIHHPD